MHHEGEADNSALVQLRSKLSGGLAKLRLNKTQLAAQARLGRTTVSEAFQDGGPVPSEHTVAALAAALKLPVDDLLELRQSAARATGGAAAPAHGSGPGRPIGQWDPHALEVHPAGPDATVAADTDVPAVRVLPGYVRRGHDQVLAEAVADAGAGRSRMLVLVGASSTGKTRACWEAVLPLAALGWRLWHPFDPTRAEAALEDLSRVAPRTVVWLNEAQHYLGDGAVGERIAAAVHHLLTSPERGPVLVLGTFWPDYVRKYADLPVTGRADPHSRVRELLAGRTLSVPESFDAAALTKAAVLAQHGDPLLADALTRASTDGRIAQDLAGAPELLNRYRYATRAARALLDAAMDARRLGVGLHLPQAFLTHAVSDYLTETDHDLLTEDWAEQSFAELARLVHGKQAPLRQIRPRPQRQAPAPTQAADAPVLQPRGPMHRLADYLEQHGNATRRRLCPPASFWHAALTHCTSPDDLHRLANAAEARCRLQWAHHLRLHAIDAGSTQAMKDLARSRQEEGDREGAEALARQAADAGSPDALVDLARQREWAGDEEGAEVLYRQAANAGHTGALGALGPVGGGTGSGLSRDGRVGHQQAAGCQCGEAAGVGSQRGEDRSTFCLGQAALECLASFDELPQERGTSRDHGFLPASSLSGPPPGSPIRSQPSVPEAS
ncbi:hypothetical protein [Streptomyces chartreusis]